MAQDARGQHQDCTQEREQGLEGDANEAKRQ